MLDKVTRWVLCLPDNAMASSEGHVPFLPLQLSSNRRKSVVFGHNVRIFLCSVNPQNVHFSN